MQADWKYDILKQGFMKPRKQKMVTLYSVWTVDETIGRFVCCKTEDKKAAEARSRRENGTITTSKELR